MDKLRLDIEELKVESFDAGRDGSLRGTVRANDGSCSMQPTCGIASRAETAFEHDGITRNACCV